MIVNDESSRIYRGDVAKHWGLIKAGLEQIKEQQSPDWTLGDIYSLCESGSAHLFLSDDGFVVLQVGVNAFTDETYLFCLIAFSRALDGFKRYLPELERFARDVGATYIEMLSRRKGWERLGWTKGPTRFRWRL